MNNTPSIPTPSDEASKKLITRLSHSHHHNPAWDLPSELVYSNKIALPISCPLLSLQAWFCFHQKLFALKAGVVKTLKHITTSLGNGVPGWKRIENPQLAVRKPNTQPHVGCESWL